MRYPVVGLLLTALLAGMLGCGALQVRGTFNPSVQTVSGFVASVQVTNVPGSNGTLIQVTVVTLQQPPTLTTASFCGNFGSQFPVNSFVQVDFRPGQPCATIVLIRVG